MDFFSTKYQELGTDFFSISQIPGIKTPTPQRFYIDGTLPATGSPPQNIPPRPATEENIEYAGAVNPAVTHCCIRCCEKSCEYRAKVDGAVNAKHQVLFTAP